MYNTTRMNIFLQRMLRTSDEKLNADKEAEKAVEEPVKAGFTKGTWTRKLGNYSPGKQKTASSPRRMKTPELEAVPPRTIEKPEMPDLESIIREFETGFLSPRKNEAALEAMKQRNFVKKIVAAFEVKYKTYNDWKDEQEIKEHLDTKRRSMEERKSPDPKQSPKRRSCIFPSPFKVAHQTPDRKEEISQLKSSTSDLESGCESEPSSTPARSPRGIGLFSSPFNGGRSVSGDPNRRSGVYMTPVNFERQDSGAVDLGSFSDACSVFKFDKDESRIENTSSGYFSTRLSLDETKSLDGVDLDSTFDEPDETILVNVNGTIAEESRLEEDLESSRVADRTPKIVGAFLKKPIECQDTSIDWIPIPGKKLPRKRSLKKILSLFTSKSSYEKKTKLYCSERNLNEEPRELQDSGYEERSCSSSSLASLISINDILLQQKNTYVEPERRRAMKTFRSNQSLDQEEDKDEPIYDTCGNVTAAKRLVLTEMPREDVKLDLGPCYPSSSKLATMSLDRRTPQRNPSPQKVSLTRIPKHPFLSKIPKHPFVSTTKIDEPEEEEDTSPTKTIRNGLYEVEFHRSCEDFTRRSPEDTIYDVPRRFISKSESEIPWAGRSSRRRPNRDEHAYDVPRSHSLTRPRSSVLEDAVSLRRRAEFLRGNSAPEFYRNAEPEPYYATVKPRNRRTHLTRQVMLAASSGDLSRTEKSSSL